MSIDRDKVAATFARKADWLDDRNHRLGCPDCNMRDPRELAATVEQAARVLTGSVAGHFLRMGNDPVAVATELGARIIFLLEALERTDLLRLDLGDEAA